MLQYIREYDQYVEITGYRGVSFEAAEALLKKNRKQTTQDLNVQFFEADYVATSQHLYFAVLNALQAFQNKTNRSKTPAMETILYASAQRQIQKAIERCGIKPQTKNMALTIIGEDPKQIETTLETVNESIGSFPDETVLEMTKAKSTKIEKVFQLTKEELATVMTVGDQTEAIVNLVIERVALLSTQF